MKSALQITRTTPISRSKRVINLPRQKCPCNRTYYWRICLHAHFILTIYAFLLFISFYTCNTEHLRLFCKFVVDTLLNFPTFFNIIVTNIDTSRVNAFRRPLVSGQDWAHKSVSFRLVSAISRTETGITARYLEVTSSSLVNTLITWAWPKKSNWVYLFWFKIVIGTQYVQK